MPFGTALSTNATGKVTAINALNRQKYFFEFKENEINININQESMSSSLMHLNN